MKITIDKRGSREYYEEFLFVVSNYRRYRRKPNTKAQTYSKYMRNNYIVIGLCLLILGLYSYISKDRLYLALILVCIALLCYTIYYHHNTNEMIKAYLNDTSIKTLEIDKEGVCYTDPTKSYKLKWENIKYILINKYSISFIPENASMVVISTDLEYKDQVFKALKEVNKENLVVDNSSLYR